MKTALTFLGRKLLSAFIFWATSSKARTAITDAIKRYELPENKETPGKDKFAGVKQVALQFLKDHSDRFVDAVINNLVLLVKG